MLLANYQYECHCTALFSGERCGNPLTLIGLIAGLIGGVIVVYLLYRIVTFIQKARQDADTIREREKRIDQRESDIRVKENDIEELEEGTRIYGSELELQQCLGSGSFGTVWKALYRDIPVAVKFLHQPDRNRMARNATLRDAWDDVNEQHGTEMNKSDEPFNGQ